MLRAARLAAFLLAAAGGLAHAAEPVCDADIGECQIAGIDEAFSIAADSYATSVSIGYARAHSSRPTVACSGANKSARRAGIVVESRRYGVRIRVFPGDLGDGELRARPRWTCAMLDDECDAPAGGGCARVLAGTGGTWAAGVGGIAQIKGGAGGATRWTTVDNIGASLGGGRGDAGGASIGGGSAWGARGGNARVSAGMGSPGGDVFFSTDGIDRVWLDHGGTFRYNGAEVANRADVFRATLGAAFIGAMLALLFARLSARARWRFRIAQIRAWRKSQERSADAGAYRGTNNSGPR